MRQKRIYKMFVHESLVLKISSHNNSAYYGSDVYQYDGLDESERCFAKVDFSTSDGRLHDVHVRVYDSNYDYLTSEIHLEYFRDIFSLEMAEADIENASECGRTLYFD